MLTVASYPSYHARAVDLGAMGYLSKMASVDQILVAIRAVAPAGPAYPSDTRRSANEALRLPTPRELEILGLVAEGLSNVEIAERLSLRVKTVESQLRRLFDRYDVTSRTALARVAVSPGLDRRDRADREASERVAGRVISSSRADTRVDLGLACEIGRVDHPPRPSGKCVPFESRSPSPAGRSRRTGEGFTASGRSPATRCATRLGRDHRPPARPRPVRPDRPRW